MKLNKSYPLIIDIIIFFIIITFNLTVIFNNNICNISIKLVFQYFFILVSLFLSFFYLLKITSLDNYKSYLFFTKQYFWLKLITVFSFILSLLSSILFSFCNDCIVNKHISTDDIYKNITIINRDKKSEISNKDYLRILFKVDSLVKILHDKKSNCDKIEIKPIIYSKNSECCDIGLKNDNEVLKRLFLDLQLYNYSQDRKILLKRYDSLFKSYKVNILAKDTVNQSIYNIQNIYNHKYKEKNMYKEKVY